MSTELARRQEFRPLPIPKPLEEAGLTIAIDERTGARAIVIPASVRERCNVIDPVTSLVQADPNWSPRISMVELDPDAKAGKHFYEQAGRKLAPTKQALETLAKAAGILYTKTSRIPRAELNEGEVGYVATVGVRRSDGTVEEIQREKVWVEEAERAEIEDAVTRAEEWSNGQKTGNPRFGHQGEPSWVNEVNKRWLKELKDRYAKTESKAVLRAIRAALQIPHTFTTAEAQKPFLVIGFNFTPDYTDAEVRRIMTAVGLNAQAALYGNGGQTAALPAATETAPEPPDEAAAPGGEGTTGAGESQEGEATPETNERDAASPSPDADIPIEEPAQASFADMAPNREALLEKALATEIPSKANAGKTIAQRLKAKDHETWLANALTIDWPDDFRSALELVAEEKHPKVFKAWKDKQEGAEG